MLHILLLILKIIGIILAVILGILVLLVCIVMFVPVRYEATALCPGTLAGTKGKAKVTWLLHLIRADLYYKENRLKWRLRIGWKKFVGGADYGEKKPSDEMETENRKTYIKEEEQKDEKKDDEAWENPEDEEGKKGDFKALEKSDEAKEGCQAISEGSEEEKCEAEGIEAEEAQNEWFEAWGPEMEEFWYDEAGDQGGDEDQGLFEKIKSRFRRIKCTIQDICDNIKELLEKKNRILEFIQDESHVNAFAKLKKEAFKLLRRLRPGKLEAEAVFGFDDPSVTGKTLAVLSVFYPAYGSWVSLHPDFEKKVLKGKLYGKGHIRFIHFAVFAWNLLWSRHVRSTYKDIRNFELNVEGD